MQCPIMTDVLLTSRIDEVTVFRLGARVRRVADLVAGARRVRLVRLPLTLEDGSVRARIVGEGAVATDLRVALDVPPPDPSLAPPRDEEVLAAKLEVARLRDEMDRLNAMLGRVGKLAVGPRPEGRRGEPPIESPAEARRALVALRIEEHARISAELTALEGAHRAAERTLASLKDRASRATTARNAREHELWKSVIVALEGEPRAGAKLHLEYMVPGARWSPAYSLYQGGNGAELTMRAAVAQRTGEDWKEAKLVLSTADAERWTELPELKSIRIGRAQRHKPARGWREPPVGALELYADYDRVFGGTPTSMPTGGGFAEDADEELAEGETTPTNLMVPFELAADEPAEMARNAPRQQAAPAPAAMPMMMQSASIARAKGSMLHALGGAIGGALEAFGGAPPAPPGLGAPRSMSKKLSRREAEPAPGPAGLDLEVLAYARLRMPAASAAGRGALVAVGVSTLYAESLEGKSVSLDVAAAIRVAVRGASSDALLPAGYLPVEAADDFDYAYEARTPVSVPSDGAFHVVTVASHRADARLRYVAVPREEPDVFRVLELSSPLDAALLHGPVDVYQGGAYLMTSLVPSTPPRGKVELGLGVEQGIKVARNTSFKEESTGLLGGGLSLHHEIDVDVVNALDEPVELEVRERVPVVRKDDEDTKVEVTEVEPAWKAWTEDDSLDGGHVWRVPLAAGETKQLHAKYVVKLSSKQELVGGNRREL